VKQIARFNPRKARLRHRSARSVRLAWAALALTCIHASVAPGAVSRVRALAQHEPCTPRDGLSFICGPEGSEDIVRIPGTTWLIASGLNLGRPAHLFLIDARRKRASVLFPAAGALAAQARMRSASGCAGPPDPARMSMDGLGLRAGPSGRDMLYAANHGDRMAIEEFAVDARMDPPRAMWVDCAPLPAGTLPNAVAPLADSGFLVTTFYDPRDQSSWERMARAERTGRILKWEPESGFRTLPGSEMSGANGLATSRDGRIVYASAWSARKVLLLPVTGGRRREIPLDFMPDNIHLLVDGTLLVGGQRTTVERIARCGGGACPQAWAIVRIDPRSGVVQPLLTRPGTPEVNYACGGIELGGVLYFTDRGTRSVAYISLTQLPSLK